MTSSGHGSPAAAVRAGAIAGASTLVLAVLALFGTSAVHAVLTKGHAVTTAQDVARPMGPLWPAIAALMLAAVLDIVIARALRIVLLPVGPRAAAVAAAFRIAYAGVFIVAIGQLALVAGRGRTPGSMLSGANRFDSIWHAGLPLFGVHLLLVGYLLLRSDFTPRLLGVLVAVAGAGYVIDGVGDLLAAGFPVRAAVFTFAGEPLLALWLLARYVRRAPEAGAPRTTRFSGLRGAVVSGASAHVAVEPAPACG